MSYVLEGLYIGGVDDVCDLTELRNKGVTHVLTVNNKPVDQKICEEFAYKYIHALDMESCDLLSHFMECIEFIDEARNNNGCAIVHCFYGQSRSSTIVLAYLMSKMGLCLDDALTLLLKQRSQIRPNPGFREQLELFESMGHCIDSTDQQYKLFKLNNLAARMKSVHLSEPLPDDLYSCDPAAQGQGHGNSETLYKCKKCRRRLFTQTSVLTHNRGCGQLAFDWRSRLPSSERQRHEGETEECRESLFIQPVRWMADDILQMEGKISCPKCCAKLGSFNWAGSQCSCGTWNTPSFHIQTAKVDITKPAGQPGNSQLLQHQPAFTPGGSSGQATLDASGDCKTEAEPVKDKMPKVQTESQKIDNSSAGSSEPGGSSSNSNGITDSPSGITDSPSGRTDSPSGRTDSPSGRTDSPSGRTDSPSGRTDSPSGRRRRRNRIRTESLKDELVSTSRENSPGGRKGRQNRTRTQSLREENQNNSRENSPSGRKGHKNRQTNSLISGSQNEGRDSSVTRPEKTETGSADESVPGSQGNSQSNRKDNKSRRRMDSLKDDATSSSRENSPSSRNRKGRKSRSCNQSLQEDSWVQSTDGMPDSKQDGRSEAMENQGVSGTKTHKNRTRKHSGRSMSPNITEADLSYRKTRRNRTKSWRDDSPSRKADCPDGNSIVDSPAKKKGTPSGSKFSVLGGSAPDDTSPTEPKVDLASLPVMDADFLLSPLEELPPL